MMFGKANTIEAIETNSVSDAPQREKCSENPNMEVCPFDAPPRYRLAG